MKIQGIILIAILQINQILGQNIKANINFLVTKTGSTFTSTFNNGAALQAFCDVSMPITILVHGYTEKPNATWRSPLTSNFLDFRGGCVIWMDWGYYSGSSSDLIVGYTMLKLTGQYGGIRQVLQEYLVHLKNLRYPMSNVFIFGFSLGAHFSLEAAYNFKLSASAVVGRVDGCDPAGPLFTASSPSVKNAKIAAINVQIVHTQYNTLGTQLRFGQKDISMGRCGKSQAAGTDDKSNHKLCPVFYTNSFNTIFPLISKATIQKKYGASLCKTSTLGLTDGNVPTPAARMGYYLDFSIANGMYYADTVSVAPYNVQI